jgi:mannose-6-phosphate isomerase-like protein (cupin superfamily)
MNVSNLDAAKPFRSTDSSVIRELAGRVSLPSVHQSLAEASLPVGGATDEHYHPISEELYFFLAGTARMRLGDKQLEVGPGDCVLIAPGVVHKLVNTGDEPLRLLCCCSPPWTPEDTELTGG